MMRCPFGRSYRVKTGAIGNQIRAGKAMRIVSRHGLPPAANRYLANKFHARTLKVCVRHVPPQSSDLRAQGQASVESLPLQLLYKRWKIAGIRRRFASIDPIPL